MPELKYQVCVVLRRESGLLSFNGSKLERDRMHAGTISSTVTRSLRVKTCCQ